MTYEQLYRVAKRKIRAGDGNKTCRVIILDATDVAESAMDLISELLVQKFKLPEHPNGDNNNDTFHYTLPDTALEEFMQSFICYSDRIYDEIECLMDEALTKFIDRMEATLELEVHWQREVEEHKKNSEVWQHGRSNGL